MRIAKMLVTLTVAALFSVGALTAQTTLKMFSWYGTEAPSYDATFLALMKTEVPGVKVEIDPVVWDQMHPALQARIAGNLMPDIVDFKGQDIAKYGSAGNLLDLSGQAWLSAIPASARENLKVGGKEYGVPYSAVFQGVMYNRAIFKKHGIAIPKTYDELMAAAKALKAKGVTPFAVHYKDNWNIGNITMQFAMAEVFNDNPKWGDDLRAGKVTFEKSDGYRRVFQHVKDLYDNSWKDVFSVDFTEASKRFVKGEAAMFPTGTWVNSNLIQDPTFDWGIFPFPGKKAGAKLIFEPNHTWAISAKTKDKAAAFKVLEAVVKSKKLAQVLVEEAATYSLLSGVDSSKPFPEDKDIEMYKSANNIVDVSIGNNQIKWAYQEEYSRYISEWILGSKTLDEALQAATAFREKVK